MKNKIIEIINKSKTTPFLFVGSGLSRRYLNLDNWEELLHRFAKKINDDEFVLNAYKQKAITFLNTEADRNLILPTVATLIEKDFNTQWYSTKRPKILYKKYKRDIDNQTSPLKIEIAEYINSNSTNYEPKYAKEIELLKELGDRSISGIITTNYDSFLETIFPTYTVFHSQDDLIFNPDSMGISEIYKIHGSVNNPSSLVLTDSDYRSYATKYAYLAAKLLTIFIERPIIFMGYSISDKNILDILDAILQILPDHKLEELKERLFFVQWGNGSPDSIESFSKSLNSGSKTVSMTKIVLNDYSVLYEALLENKSRYRVNFLRRIKNDIYQIVSDKRENEKVKLVSLEDADSDTSVEYVIGVGIFDKFSNYGYKGVSAKELYRDILFDDLAKDDINKNKNIIEQVFPEIMKANSNKLPMFKYLRSISEDNIPADLKKHICENYSSLIGGSVHKKIKPDQDWNIDKLIKQYKERALYHITDIPEDKIPADELFEYLVKFYKDHPTILDKDHPNPTQKTLFKKAIRIYDWLKYK